MIELDDAQARVLAHCAPLETEVVAIGDALGRACASDVRSPVDLPPFDRSAMDGYAVRAADLPGPLRLVGDVAAGSVGGALAPGTCVGISTGSAIPDGADAVLPHELAELAGDIVRATEPVEAGRHIRRRAEDVARGDVLAAAGTRLAVQRVSALASAGVGAVEVHRRARLHLVVTGSELVAPGSTLEPGAIFESNGVTLRALASRAGALVTHHGIAPDNPAETRELLRAALRGDVAVVTGGVSVGEHDHVRPALAALGVEERFWRVRVRPGKPIWFGTRDRTLVFGLPGNPLSAVVGFLAFVEPALRRLAGEPGARMNSVPARLTAAADPGPRTSFLTARLAPAADGALEATPTARQGSHMTGALGEADGFVVLDAPARAGDVVPAVVL